MDQQLPKTPKNGLAKTLRPSGYVSRWEEIWYGLSGPFYDALARWCLLPLGGEKACRKRFTEWFELQDGQEVLSLCCGTGATERSLKESVPSLHIRALDLGSGQIATARRKDPGGLVHFEVGNAADTGFPAASFDRVLITLALHEMPQTLRVSVLREAARVCRPSGRVIAIEHAAPDRRLQRALRWFWWFFWVPGNPEVRTTRDLQRAGLANEMTEAGLRVMRRHTTRPDWIEGVVAMPEVTPQTQPDSLSGP